MQKIIFYQEVQPKAADALWLHHGYDSEGNKKESISIDYIQNGVVRHIMDAGEGGSSDVSQTIASEYNNFNPIMDYFSGDFVVKDGLLYVFISDHTAGEWNEDEVEATNVLDELAGLWYEAASASEDRAVLNGQIETLQGEVTSLKKALGTLVAGDTLCFTALDANSSIKISKVGKPSIIPSLEYSTDGMTWQSYTIENNISATSVGDTVYFRSDGTTTTFSETDSKYFKFVMEGRFAASGSVMSLIDKNLEGNVSMGDYCFANLFYGCSGLTVAPKLPATTLSKYCYDRMFLSCTGLTAAPELPATTLANGCYCEMFSGCTGLTAAPELPATTLVGSCYHKMFYSCSNLNYIKALFITTLGYDTTNWVSGVAANGTFVKSASASWDITGHNGVPSGWTVQTV